MDTPKVAPGERIYAIGDVHGRLDLLERLIGAIRRDSAARPEREVKLVLLGDIVDLGDDSEAIVATCMEFTARSPNFIVLKGNHEEMMVRAYRGDKLAMRVWQASGGAATLYSWGVDAGVIDAGDPSQLREAMRVQVPGRVIAWLEALPIRFVSGDYFFVHAGVRPGIPLDRQRTEDMLWIKEEFTRDEHRHPMRIVHGHSECDEGPEFRSNRIGIDTAAYRTDILTALGLEDDDEWTLSTEEARPHTRADQ